MHGTHMGDAVEVCMKVKVPGSVFIARPRVPRDEVPLACELFRRETFRLT